MTIQSLRVRFKRYEAHDRGSDGRHEAGNTWAQVWLLYMIFLWVQGSGFGKKEERDSTREE